MPASFDGKLVVAISSRALFDLSDSHRVFEKEGLDAFQDYQIAHEDDVLPPGDAFPLVTKLLAINEREKLRWPGTKHTPAVEGLGVYPRPVNDALPIWIAAGGTPQSMVRAGALGTPLALAIIGGEPRRFKPLADLYRRAAEQAGNSDKARVSLNVHGFVGEDGKAAADLFYPAQKAVMDQLGRERGWGPQSRAQYDASCGPEGAMFVGSPAQITDKILGLREDLGFDRVTIQMAIGVIDHAEMLKAIEVLGTQVAPELRKAG